MAHGLVIGEALIDVVERPGSAVGAAQHVGGSPLNVAAGLARLGRSIDFLTHIADDHAGRRIADHVRASGARLVRGSMSAPRTPTARATIEGDGSASYLFDLDWRLEKIPEIAAPLFVHTGSIAAIREPGCVAVADLVERYRPRATVTLDPNVRPSLIDDPERARARIERLVERSDVVKVSDEDLRWLRPDTDPDEAARTWLASGPALVVVTQGARGSIAFCAAGRARAGAERVRVVDTVGAGDAFMVGLLDALWGLGLLGDARRSALRQVSLDDLADALTAATRCSALTVARAGADLPDRAALDGDGPE